MRKFLFLLLAAGGSVFAYFWYVRGINLLQREDANPLPYYGIATRLPPKLADGKRAVPVDVDAFSWYAATGMLRPRVNAAVAAIGSHVYVIGGVDGFDRTLSDVEMYDTKSDNWTKLHPMPRATEDPAIVAIDGKIYVFGGFEGVADNPLNTLWIYDPGTDQWKRGKDLPAALGGAAAVAADGKIHLFGGKSLGTDVDTHSVYDPATDTWKGDIEMHIGRERMDAVLVGRKIYLIGGRQGSRVYNVDSVEVYDLDRKTWDTISLMPRKRSNLTALPFQGKIYVFGGEAPTFIFGEVDVYDVAANRWSTLKKPLPHPRYGLGGAVVDGKFFLMGGGQRPGLSVSAFNEVLAPPGAAPAAAASPASVNALNVNIP